MLHRRLLTTVPEAILKPFNLVFRCYGSTSNEVALRQEMSLKEEWKRRTALRAPKIQRFEVMKPKMFYAPDWELGENPDKSEGIPDPLTKYGTTPEKWEYYNTVVWPPGFVVPETGFAKRREVYHCKQSVHCHPKKIFKACHLVRRRNVDDALVQLEKSLTRAAAIMREVLIEAKKRAKEEFYIEFPSEMHVAEAFGIQCKIVKSSRRHAHEQWATLRHRYVNVFVRLEEGESPGLIDYTKNPNGWEQMEEYYQYLRGRTIKYSI
ncbi:unnamed protein product [Enterobius vermicularis]|uniref:Large ribosomal subunit protein uL22m n=1 Tax=Enterobius vermicularis TaxID=51028 RepID=A0A0N4V9G3_ENTVE|nr:unnamed protein product [Enterobius vermicularis]